MSCDSVVCIPDIGERIVVLRELSYKKKILAKLGYFYAPIIEKIKLEWK